MTEVQPPSWMAGECYTAEADRMIINSLVCSPGIAAPGALAVNPGEGLTVTVDPGAAFIEGTITASQGMYHVVNDSLVVLSLEGADVTDVRYDLVVATVNDSAYAGDVNNWVLQVITGVPSPTPVVPDVPESSIALAVVTVGPGVTTIGPDEIDDLREVYSSCSAPIALPTISRTSAGASTFDPSDYPGMTMVYVECIGGGGGGGGAGTTSASDCAAGSGGGGGGFAAGWIPIDDLDGPVTVTVGGGGGAGSSGGSSPGNGGASSFGAFVIANGGGAGISAAGAAGSFSIDAGGNGGLNNTAGTHTSTAIDGQDGYAAAGSGAANIISALGRGGAAARGGGGGSYGGVDNTQTGSPGKSPGGGGAGGFNRNSQSFHGGADGAAGGVFITVYR